MAITARAMRPLGAILLVALALRVWAVATLPEEERLPKYDAAQYDTLAMSLAEGRGLAWPPSGMPSYYPLPPGPTSYRAPGYPLFLSVIYRLFGHNYTAVRLAQAALGTFLCFLLYAIGARWLGRGMGLLAAAIGAVYAPFIHFSFYGGPGFLLSEGLFMTLLAAAVWCAMRLADDVRDRRAAALAGLLFGLATLTRPVTLLVPGLLLAWALCAPRADRLAWLRAVAITTTVFLLTLAPWIARNYRVHGRFVPVTSVSGKAFWVGNNAHARGGAVETPLLFTPETFDPGLAMTEVQRNDKMAQEGWAFIRQHPERLPKLFVRKALMLWNVYDLDYNLWYGLLVPWALIGLFAARRIGPTQVHRLLLGLLLYQTMISLITFGSTRYRYPFEPYVIVLAAAGLWWWVRHPAAARVKLGVPAATVAANAACFVYSDQLLAGLRAAFQTIGMR